MLNGKGALGLLEAKLRPKSEMGWIPADCWTTTQNESVS